MTATLQIKKNRPTYYILLRYPDELTGKERQKWVTTDIPIKGNNKRKAEAKLSEVLTEYENAQIDLSTDVLFADFMEIWLENLKYSIAPITYDSYNLVLKKHITPYFAPKKIKVRELTPLHIQQYINFKIRKSILWKKNPDINRLIIKIYCNKQQFVPCISHKSILSVGIDIFGGWIHKHQIEKFPFTNSRRCVA